MECAASTSIRAIAMTGPFELGLGYRLNPDVALRPEPFGALAYHFGTRRLSFLKAPELVELVCALGADSVLGSGDGIECSAGWIPFASTVASPHPAER